MSLFASLGALELGFIYGLVALGVFISFKILRFPDLTVDGTFATGGAVTAVLMTQGVDPFSASAMAMVVCAFAGMITGWLNVKLGIMDLLASILMMTALYSINLRIMGGPNVPLIMNETVFTLTQLNGLEDFHWRPLLLLVVIVAVKFIMDWFYRTEIGLAMRSTGSNLRMARAQGISTDRMVMLGMAISNALVGLGGALFVQSQGGSDISMGIGTIVIGLAAVIVGQSLITSRRFFLATLAVIVGAVLYRFFIALALNSDFVGLKAQDLNLVTALLVTIALVLPKLKQRIKR